VVDAGSGVAEGDVMWRVKPCHAMPVSAIGRQAGEKTVSWRLKSNDVVLSDVAG